MTSLLRAEDVARRLSISPRAVYRLAERGELPAIRWGRVVRFDPEALERWLAEHATNGAHR